MLDLRARRIWFIWILWLAVTAVRWNLCDLQGQKIPTFWERPPYWEKKGFHGLTPSRDVIFSVFLNQLVREYSLLRSIKYKTRKKLSSQRISQEPSGNCPDHNSQKTHFYMHLERVISIMNKWIMQTNEGTRQFKSWSIHSLLFQRRMKETYMAY